MKFKVYRESVKQEPVEKAFSLRLRDGALGCGVIFVQMYGDDEEFIDCLIKLREDGTFSKNALFTTTKNTGIQMDNDNRMIESGSEEEKLRDDMATVIAASIARFL